MNAKKVILGALVPIVAGCSSAVAFGATPDLPWIHDSKGGRPTPQAVSPTAARIADSFHALRDSSRKAQDATQARMRDQMGSTSGSDHGPVGTADFSKATSSKITGSDARASIVPSGNRACIVLPDPVDGYGAACATLKEIAAGHGFVALGPVPGSAGQTATIGVLVPDGGAVPSITTSAGRKAYLAVDGNVAAAVVAINSGARLDIGAESIPLRSFLPSSRTQ